MKTYILNYDSSPIKLPLNIETTEKGDEICEKLLNTKIDCYKLDEKTENETLRFERWEKENEDRLIDNYLLDLNGLIKEENYDEIKSIIGYWEYARNIFDDLGKD